MKRRPIIGLSATVLVLSVIIGIASLPDEVLIESSSIDKSPTQPEDIQFAPTKEELQESIPYTEDTKNIDNTKAELDALKKEIKELKNEIVEIKINSEIPDDIPLITEVEDVPTEERSHEDSQGKVITISLKDGVGARMR